MSLVEQAEPADTVTVETETVSSVEALIKDVEVWLKASTHRTILEGKDIRELQDLLLEVWGVLTTAEPNSN